MIQQDTIYMVVSKALNKTIVQADYQTQQLHGGTLGDVRLVFGDAKTIEGEELPFRLVWKRQKKWERPGDPQSWRREFDFYTIGMGSYLPDQFRWPVCYHATINDGETHLWLEYIEGISGQELTIDMLEQVAEGLGCFQGELFSQQNTLHTLSYLSKVDTLPKEYKQWLPNTVEYQYLRSDTCTIPKHLRQMLIDIQAHSEQIFTRMDNLPKVLCQKDFWFENIFWVDGEIVIIDWDCVGWGYMGEDVASLIADDTVTDSLLAYYQRIVPAYFRGIRSQMDISWIEDFCLWEMMIIKFGYRVLQAHQFAGTDAEREAHVKRLQTLYELRDLKVEV